MKQLEPGGCFETPEAVLSVCVGGIYTYIYWITRTVQNHLTIHPDEERMPVGIQ